jgi:hypothetical protein
VRVLSCRVLTCPVVSCRVLSCPDLSCRVLSCPVLSPCLQREVDAVSADLDKVVGMLQSERVANEAALRKVHEECREQVSRAHAAVSSVQSSAAAAVAAAADGRRADRAALDEHLRRERALWEQQLAEAVESHAQDVLQRGEQAARIAADLADTRAQLQRASTELQTTREALARSEEANRQMAMAEVRAVAAVVSCVVMVFCVGCHDAALLYHVGGGFIEVTVSSVLYAYVASCRRSDRRLGQQRCVHVIAAAACVRLTTVVLVLSLTALLCVVVCSHQLIVLLVPALSDWSTCCCRCGRRGSPILSHPVSPLLTLLRCTCAYLRRSCATTRTVQTRLWRGSSRLRSLSSSPSSRSQRRMCVGRRVWHHLPCRAVLPCVPCCHAQHITHAAVAFIRASSCLLCRCVSTARRSVAGEYGRHASPSRGFRGRDGRCRGQVAAEARERGDVLDGKVGAVERGCVAL